MIKKPTALFWHRRDLRCDDLPALTQCIKEGFHPVCVFILDSTILEKLDPKDRRVSFIHLALEEMKKTYASVGILFLVSYGDPLILIPKIAQEQRACKIFCHEDYEPSSQSRDSSIKQSLSLHSIDFYSCKDHVIFSPNEILNQQKQPFHVYTHYMNQWMKLFQAQPPKTYPTLFELKNLGAPSYSLPIDNQTLTSSNLPPFVLCGALGAQTQLHQFLARVHSYDQNRDIPSKPLSHLGIHFRFGTLSIRQALSSLSPYLSTQGAQVWLKELIWRDFYAHILGHHPRLFNGEDFLSIFKNYPYTNQPSFIEAWKNGQTGFPIVDAGMRQLLNTGYMHNRVRMISAQFLVKHLDCDWRIGEAHFANHLLDFEFSSNNGGWQWSSSTGTDAQPYFRIFNPFTQSEKFDPEGTYIRSWVPELSQAPSSLIHHPSSHYEALKSKGILIGSHYPQTIVDYTKTRAQYLTKAKTWIDQHRSS